MNQAFQLKITDNYGTRLYTTFAPDMNTAIMHVRAAVADAAEDPVEEVQCIDAKLIEGEVVVPAFPKAVKPRDPADL